MNIAVKVTAAETAAEIAATPIEKLNPARVDRFYHDTIWPVFERLRREDPVHFTPESEYGPYWSVTKWNDIMAVDTDHEAFSSADGIGLANLEAVKEQERVMGERRRGNAGFITMDEPEHGPARKAVSPTLAPSNLQSMAPLVRERAGQILDSLPIGQEFDWVDLVSKELTAMTLASLFDFPFEQRRKLPWWSDMVMNLPGHGPVESWEQKGAAIFECFGAFTELWNQRVNAPPGNDLISMLAHNGQRLCAEQEPRPVRQAARQPRPRPADDLRDDPLADPAGPHEPGGDARRGTGRQDHQEGRAGGHVVHLRQSRRDDGGPAERIHHRPRAAPPAHELRLRHPPLRRQPRGGDAADDHLGGNPQALPGDQGGGRPRAELVGLRPRL
jgi:hypothetical protein